tara:strand:+ start:859 stop:1338 length:480 start_codon:yes stop_codon:yes gene_type:complete
MSTLKVNALQDTSGNNLDRIGQIVTASTSSAVSTSAGSLVDSGLTANITPQFTSSKILVLIDSPFHVYRGGSTTTFNIRILRDSTSVFAGGASEADYQQGIGGSISANRICGMISKMIVDSPSSTSALTYKLQVQSGYNATVYMQDSTTAHITLMEILQ